MRHIDNVDVQSILVVGITFFFNFVSMICMWELYIHEDLTTLEYWPICQTLSRMDANGFVLPFPVILK